MNPTEQFLLLGTSALILVTTLVVFLVQFFRGRSRGGGRRLMAVFLALSAFAVLVVTLVLFLRARKEAPQGTPLPNGRALVLMTLLGLLLALASQLPLFG